MICEKPAALTVEEVNQMYDVCEQQGVMLFIAQVCRFMKPYEEAHRLLKTGRLGTPKMISMARSVQYPNLTGQDWYKDRQKSGGLFLDFIIHDLDFLTWNFGKPEVIASHFISDEANTLKGIMMILQIEDGPLIHLEGTWTSVSQELHQRLEMVASEGTMVYDSRNKVPWNFNAITGESRVMTEDELADDDPFYKELEHFIQCFKGVGQPLILRHEVTSTLETALEAREKSERGASL